MGWFARLPQDIDERFFKRKSELEYLQELNVPIYYGNDIDETKPKLQIFADAFFFQVYDSVSYIRTVDRNTCHVAFVIGKSR